jgi:hypothetical protein
MAVTRAVKRCLPGVSQDVTSQFPSSPYVYGARCSIHLTLPSMMNVTALTLDSGSDVRAVQWMR